MPVMSAIRRFRGFSRFVFYGVLLSFVGFILYCVFGIGAFGQINREFIDLPGPEARSRLQFIDGWPEQIDPAEVQKLSHKYNSAIDSHSTWYRIQIAPAAAAAWQDAIHSKEERTYEGKLSHLDQGVEGVHRSLTGPPPLHRHTGTIPGWWSPPVIGFRSTEMMKWYRRNGSGVGLAAYSAYDASTSTLWVYEYSAQHDLLWTPGNVPAGEQFTNIERAVREGGNSRLRPNDANIDGNSAN